MEILRHDVVSDDTEALILVDSEDNEIGSLDKTACHDGAGLLHRAFSVFIFNEDDELLMQKRAADKRLWPDFWSNSCCSHPRQGEDVDVAIHRRCEQELGLCTQLEYAYKFEYSAEFGEIGTEHELCSVYVGTFAGELNINTAEVSAIKWLSIEAVDRELYANTDQYKHCSKLQLLTLRAHFTHPLPRG